jgi:hypothetical protein
MGEGDPQQDVIAYCHFGRALALHVALEGGAD